MLQMIPAWDNTRLAQGVWKSYPGVVSSVCSPSEVQITISKGTAAVFFECSSSRSKCA